MKLTTEWDLSQIYPSIDAAKVDFEKYKKMCERMTTFKGTLNSREPILGFFRLEEEAGLVGDRLGSYAFLRKSLNGKDEQARAFIEEIEAFSNEISPRLAFVDAELTKNSDSFLKELMADPEFKDFTLDLEDVIRGRKHILKEQVQSVINMMPSLAAGEEAFDNLNDIDMRFGYIKTENGREKLTHATYGKFMSSGDQKIRKAAHVQYHKVFGQFNYTLGSLYLSDAKNSVFLSRLHKFASVHEYDCFDGRLDPKILRTLFDAVHKHLELYHRYERLKKRALNLRTYYAFDNNAELGSDNAKYDYDKACDIVLSALRPMGEEYLGVMRRAMQEGWIDVYEKPAKTSGGFCSTVYGLHPYVLLNYDYKFESVSTLAHELGHALHGYYTCKTQPYSKASPGIFACEVASIVNEMILALYMIDHAKTDEQKIYFIDHTLKQVNATLFRQTMFAEFEDYVHTSLGENKPLIVENLNEKYEQLQKQYYGKDAKLTPVSKFEWSRIPHFYSPYYVYKYATGFVSACTIASNILADREYIPRYIDFLKAGASVDVLPLLQSVGVDLTKSKAFDGAFELYERLLDQFERLIH